MTTCILEEIAGNLASGSNGSTVAMGFFFVIASICAVSLGVYIWHGRRSRPFSALQFDNPIYRRTTEDPDNFEFSNNQDNSLGAFPSDTNPPLLPSRLVLNNQPTSQSAAAAPLNTNSSDFYHPNNYAYDQPIVKEGTDEVCF